MGQAIYARLPITRFLFDQLRVEANALLAATVNRVSPAARRRLRKLRGERGLLLNVACGPQVLPGFVNLDLHVKLPGVVRWDCRRRLPVGDGAAEGIRAEQFVEHLETQEELPAFLADCRRALAAGGVLRVIVPDAGRFLAAYCRSASGDLGGFRELAVPEPFPSDLPTRMDVVNHIFHQWQEHRWGYDAETLTHRLRAAGFERIEVQGFGRSLEPRLAMDREVHAPYSLYVDAVR